MSSTISTGIPHHSSHSRAFSEVDDALAERRGTPPRDDEPDAWAAWAARAACRACRDDTSSGAFAGENSGEKSWKKAWEEAGGCDDAEAVVVAVACVVAVTGAGSMPRSATERMWESASPRWSLDDRDICCVMILPSADLLSAKPCQAPCRAYCRGILPERPQVVLSAARRRCRRRAVLPVAHRIGSTMLSPPQLDRCCRIRYQHVCSYPPILRK